jgi:hypothetical protein
MALVRNMPMRDAPTRDAPYERHAYKMADGRDTPMRDKPMRWPMRDTRLWERHAYAYEMAPVRGTPMTWPMRDARLWGTRLWDGFCEKHAYERHAYLHRLEKKGGAFVAGGGVAVEGVPPAAISRGLI